MRQPQSSRDIRPTAETLREPQYVPVSPAGELADAICSSVVGRSISLRLLEIRPDRITLAVIPSREP